MCDYVLVHVRAVLRGDDCDAEANLLINVYVGDFDSVEEKIIVLWDRAEKRARELLEVNIDAIEKVT